MFISWCFLNTLCEDVDNSYSYSNYFLKVMAMVLYNRIKMEQDMIILQYL